MGAITDVRFTNVNATSEAGVVIAGCAQSTIDGLVFDGVNLTLEQTTELPGGFLDYRPGARDVVDDVSTSAVFMEFANHVDLKNVEASSTAPRHPVHALLSNEISAQFLSRLGSRKCTQLCQQSWCCCSTSMAATGISACQHAALRQCRHREQPSAAQVVWGKPPRPEWGQSLEVTPHTVHALSVQVCMLFPPARICIMLIKSTMVLAWLAYLKAPSVWS